MAEPTEKQRALLMYQPLVDLSQMTGDQQTTRKPEQQIQAIKHEQNNKQTNKQKADDDRRSTAERGGQAGRHAAKARRGRRGRRGGKAEWKACRHLGMQAGRDAGTQARRHAGMQPCRHAGMRAHTGAGHGCQPCPLPTAHRVSILAHFSHTMGVFTADSSRKSPHS